MSKIAQAAHQHNRKPQAWLSAGQVWSIEHQINARDLLHIELHWKGTHVIADVRRWLRRPDGSEQAAQKGFAVVIRHLPAVEALIEEALAEAHAIATPATANNDPMKKATPRPLVVDAALTTVTATPGTANDGQPQAATRSVNGGIV
jgi:hypothetical protein